MTGQATFTKGAKIERVEKRLDDPTVALRQIGDVMVNESKSAFKNQAFDGVAWKPRAPIRVFGIIAAFAEGEESPPQRYLEAGPALIDTGSLRRLIGYQLIGTDVVEVGSALPYAAVQQFGGETESKPITPTVRRALWMWLKKQETPLKRKLGWMLNKKFVGKTLKQKVPARPFVGVTKTARTFAVRILGKTLLEVE